MLSAILRGFAEVQENGGGHMAEAEDPGFSVCEFSGSRVQPVTAASAPFLVSVHPLSSSTCPPETSSGLVLWKPAGLRMDGWRWAWLGYGPYPYFIFYLEIKTSTGSLCHLLAEGGFGYL